MLILDENDHEVIDPDLDKGYLIREIRVKPDAVPVDDITKFAWDDSDYEEIQRYKLYTGEDQKDFSALRRREQLEAAAALFVRSASLTDEQALSVSELYEEWSATAHYEKDDIRRYQGDLYRCKQAHNAQETWNPRDAHSLWVRIVPPGEIPNWEQPIPGVFDGYEYGQKVKHGGATWISTYKSGLNVWEPGVVSELFWKKVTE